MLLHNHVHISSPSSRPAAATSSMFADLDNLTVSTLSSIPSPSMSPAPQTPFTSPQSKTNAFFASPFDIKLPSPSPAQSLSPKLTDSEPRNSKGGPLRSLTADFFAGKPTGSLSNSSTKRIGTVTTHHGTPKSFQSVVVPVSDDATPQKARRSFLHLDLNPRNSQSIDGLNTSHKRSPLTSSFTSTPTPTAEHTRYLFPPPEPEPTMTAQGSFIDSSSEPTPRPPSTIPNLSHIPKSLSGYNSIAGVEDAEVIIASSDSASSDGHGTESIESHMSDDLVPGMIIRSVLPRDTSTSRPSSAQATQQSFSTISLPFSPFQYGNPRESSDAPASTSSSIPVALRLKCPLGSGAFSSVWLAQDLSPTPLILKSRRSLRDLRRKEEASLSSQFLCTSSPESRGKMSGRLKSSRSPSRLMRFLRGGVSGTRPGGGAGSVTRESSVNRSEGDTSISYSLDKKQPYSKGGNRFKDRVTSGGSAFSVYLDETDGEGATHLAVPSSDTGNMSLSRNSSVSWKSVSSDGDNDEGNEIALQRNRSALRKRLVAVKLTSRGVIETDKQRGRAFSAEEERERDRTRVSFVREVEILKHISHPNIAPLLSHLTTPTHHLLVLSYLPGGDLLGLVNSDGWNYLSENVLRRIFSELCKAVGWMHGVGLVHRDIKLENILLTTPLYGTHPISPAEGFIPDLSLEDSLASLPVSPLPLIKLTDFGLSRFIDPANPLLTTRCGSEAYASPELVIGGGRRGVASSPILWGGERPTGDDGRGGYDARESDAWACGVVLYGLVGRRLPFGEGPGDESDGKRIVGEGRGRMAHLGNASERMQWLIKIAKGQWEWPVHESSTPRVDPFGGLIGPGLVESAGARRLVDRLLVRDPSRRARVVDLWDDSWMDLDLPVDIPINIEDDRLSIETVEDGDMTSPESEKRVYIDDNTFGDLASSPLGDDDEDEDEEDDVVDRDGWLVDKEGISSITRQEVHGQ